MKSRIITTRLKFSAREHGRDLTEAELANAVTRALEFTDGLDHETTLDADPLPKMLAALKRADAAIQALADSFDAGDIADPRNSEGQEACDELDRAHDDIRDALTAAEALLASLDAA